jgi:AhpD family alkylhydroperoxidase
MKPRLNPYAASPKGFEPMLAMERYIAKCGLEHGLVELVKTRVSQINGCAFCLHMHTRDARKNGESEERLYLLSAWRESPLFTDRERAALAWSESLSLVAETGVPDEAYEDLAEYFTEAERVNLTLLIGTINTWNRLAIGFRSVHPVA